MSWVLAAVFRWLPLAGLYLVLAGNASRSEIAAAALTGAAAAVLSLLLRRAAGRQFDLRLPWPRLLGQMLWSLLRDLVAVQAVLIRALFARRTGRLIHRNSDRRRGRAAQAGHRAVEILTRSIAPNEYVVDDEGQALILHRLAHVPGHRDEAEHA